MFNIANALQDDQGTIPDRKASSLFSQLSESNSKFASNQGVSDFPLEGKDARMLSAAFAGLQNLKTVGVTNGYRSHDELSLRTFQLYSPTSERGVSHTDMKEYEAVRFGGWVDVYAISAHDVIPAIFEAAIENNIQLEGIHFDPRCLEARVLNDCNSSLTSSLPAPAVIFENDQCRRSFPKLRTLELPLGALENGEEQKRIFALVSLFSESLESLGLAPRRPGPLEDFNPVFDDPFEAISTSSLPDRFLDIKFPYLTSLSMKHFMTTFETINLLLLHLKDTLRVLDLDTCYIDDPFLNWRLILETVDTSMALTSFNLDLGESAMHQEPYAVSKIEHQGPWNLDSQFVVFFNYVPDMSLSIGLIKRLRSWKESQFDDYKFWLID
ncbi:hypothetical protein ABW20_dc0104470 [Dactylellina cionopaga]|nr:hypothetical protein ABW20_dc0104470 [Dactylellina cionopaga]